ncbi:GSCOCG00007891001-RA-CDS [Cotesia congregata]|nr:GSCOCG00007891001-RA-CDS [Cotesia congregata]
MIMDKTRHYQRIANDTVQNKMSGESDFGPRKTLIVLTVVAGCFAILWPKIFYPMLIGPGNTPHSPIDGSVCCDLIFETDVNAVDILQEMCKNILNHHQVDPRVRDIVNINKLSPQSINFCREQVLSRCGIDLSSFLAEEEKLGKTYKQVLEEIRSFNSSLCLKINFGVSLSRLGTPHLIRYHILMPHTPIKQERRLPPHAGGLHPAMRERGRAIPSSHIVPRVEGRPEQVFSHKMRPPMGGPGRVITPQGGSGSSMGIIMPLYTVGILLFFLYTITKVLRKNPNNDIYREYSNPEAEKEFRDRVFNPEILTSAITGVPHYRKEKSPELIKRTPTIDELKQQAAGDIEVDQLIQRLADTEAAMERIVVQMGNLSRTVAQNPTSQQDTQVYQTHFENNCCSIEELDRSSPTVKVMGMEMTTNCEGGQKISRPSTPIISHSPNHFEREKSPPKPIYLEGALPSQCELLVTDSKTQAENFEENNEVPVVLSGKMTLSLISLDQIPPNSEGVNEDIFDHKEKVIEIVPDNYSVCNDDKEINSNDDKIQIYKLRESLNNKGIKNTNRDKDKNVDEENNKDDLNEDNEEEDIKDVDIDDDDDNNSIDVSSEEYEDGDEDKDDAEDEDKGEEEDQNENDDDDENEKISFKL